MRQKSVEPIQIYQPRDSGGRWYYSFTVGRKRVQKSAYTDNYREAVVEAQKAYDAALYEFKNPTMPPILLSDALANVIDNPKLSVATKRVYSKSRDKLLGLTRKKIWHFPPEKLLHEISNTDIRELVKNRLNEGNSESTANLELFLLKNAQTLHADEYATNTKLQIKQTQTEARDRAFTDVEIRAIIDKLSAIDVPQAPLAVVLFQVLLATGARLSEIIESKSSQYDTTNLTFDVIRTKTAKTARKAVIPLPESVCDVLMPYLDKPQPFSASTHAVLLLRKAIDEVCNVDAHGLPVDHLDRCVIHTTRHTFVTRLLERGVPLATVQYMTGHRSPRMLMRYNKVSSAGDHSDAIRVATGIV